MFDEDFFDEWLIGEIRRVQGKIKAGPMLDAVVVKGDIHRPGWELTVQYFSQTAQTPPLP